MVSRSDIKDIIIFSYFTKDMIQKLLPEIELLRFKNGEIIFRRGESAHTFYSLRRGKILLEQRISEKVTISMGTVKPGYSFGWSAMLGDEKFTLDTICGEPCEVLSIRTKTMLALLEEDHSMGYKFMQQLMHMLKRRLDTRTDLLLKLLSNHPDIQPLIKEK
jgi:CRP-like cAMP-binding protein